MAFRPNYNRDRHERDRAARAKRDEKQRRKDEKSAQRKAERAATEGPADDQQRLPTELTDSTESDGPTKGAGTVDQQ
jgi:hypothetical protein